MKVLLISADGFEDSELVEPYSQLVGEGYKVDIASTQEGVIKGKHGYEASVDLLVDNVKADAYDMLFLPGGKAPAKLRKNQKVLAIARHFFEHHKPVAAICHGPQILASAGLLKGRKATSFAAIKDEIKEAGAEYIDREVVVDDNLITSRQPADLEAFISTIINVLEKGTAQPA